MKQMTIGHMSILYKILGLEIHKLQSKVPTVFSKNRYKSEMTPDLEYLIKSGLVTESTVYHKQRIYKVTDAGIQVVKQFIKKELEG